MAGITDLETLPSSQQLSALQKKRKPELYAVTFLFWSMITFNKSCIELNAQTAFSSFATSLERGKPNALSLPSEKSLSALNSNKLFSILHRKTKSSLWEKYFCFFYRSCSIFWLNANINFSDFLSNPRQDEI